MKTGTEWGDTGTKGIIYREQSGQKDPDQDGRNLLVSLFPDTEDGNLLLRDPELGRRDMVSVSGLDRLGRLSTPYPQRFKQNRPLLNCLPLRSQLSQ